MLLRAAATSAVWHPVEEQVNSATRKSPGLTKRSEEHTSELQSRQYLVCRLLLEKKIQIIQYRHSHHLLGIEGYYVGVVHRSPRLHSLLEQIPVATARLPSSHSQLGSPYE